MEPEILIQHYFQGLAQGDYQKVIRLFAQDAVVISPLYGEKLATDFYRELFSDTQRSHITLKNIFTQSQQPTIAAAHFLYEWTMKEGADGLRLSVSIFLSFPRK